MYQLTVVAGAHRTVTAHPDRDTALDALLRYLVVTDHYVCLGRTGPGRAAYALLRLPELDAGGDVSERAPRMVGHAVIEELAADPVAAPS